MTQKVSGITMRGYWRSKPVVPAERLEGAAVFAALSNQQRLLELWERDITVHSGGLSYPLLRLHSCKQLNYCLRQYMRLKFWRPNAPWMEPLVFCCWSDQDISANVGGHSIVEAITVGYPQYPAEWVVEQIANV